MRVRILAIALLLAGPAPAAQQAGPAPAAQQAPQPPPTGTGNGAAVFERACASCHQVGQGAVPTAEALRALTPEAIVNSLTIGKMAVQGATLTAAEHAAVAQFLTGRAPVAATASRPSNRCTAATPAADPAQGPRWMAWGNEPTNSRYAPQGGLTAADLPRLKLKWAFGYDGATSARVQPAMAGGKLFAASDNAELHALDPRTGCTYGTF
jgi:polyvinyl alcohol dehydrogenase (cytochrome)